MKRFLLSLLAVSFILTAFTCDAANDKKKKRIKEKIKKSQVVKNSARWHNDLNKALADARQSKRKIFLLVTGSTWCGPCMNLERKVLNHKDFASFAQKNLVLLKVDIPNGKNKKISPRPPAPRNSALFPLPKHPPPLRPPSDEGDGLASSGGVCRGWLSRRADGGVSLLPAAHPNLSLTREVDFCRRQKDGGRDTAIPPCLLPCRRYRDCLRRATFFHRRKKVTKERRLNPHGFKTSLARAAGAKDDGTLSRANHSAHLSAVEMGIAPTPLSAAAPL